MCTGNGYGCDGPLHTPYTHHSCSSSSLSAWQWRGLLRSSFKEDKSSLAICPSKFASTSIKSCTAIGSLCSLLMSNHLIPYLLLLSLEASGSSPLCQSKHLIWNLLSTLGFFYPALREGAAETLRSEKNQTHFWTCVR